jgi:WXXGXW repeat (2 copies)
MKSKLLALLFLAGSAAFAGPRFFVGVGVGPAYVPAPAYVAPAYVAPAPVAYAPGYSWIPGYYAPVGPRFVWHAGYWARPPYPHAVWVGPRYYGGHFYGGYWRR